MRHVVVGHNHEVWGSGAALPAVADIKAKFRERQTLGVLDDGSSLRFRRPRGILREQKALVAGIVHGNAYTIHPLGGDSPRVRGIVDVSVRAQARTVTSFVVVVVIGSR